MPQETTESWADASVLENEVKFFETNRASLRADHPDRFVVIKEERVVGAYETFEDAYKDGIRQLGNVPMLIRHVDQEDEVHTIPAFLYAWRNGAP